MGNDWQKFRELSENEIFKKYELIDKKGDRRTFGGDAASVIHKSRRVLDRKYFFIKVITKAPLSSEQFGLICNEVDHLLKLSHSNVVQLFETYETTYKIYMILEYLPGGEVMDRLLARGNFSEREAAHVVANVASGLSYLHAQGICHRDIKPENLYYASSDMFSKVKIGDFVLSKNIDHQMKTVCGTANYVAPEVLLNGYDDTYTKEIDLWSLGIVLFCLLCGYPPFSSSSTGELYKLIKKGQYDFHDPYWTDISDEAKDLVSKLLVVEVKQRYTAEQVLRHPWIVANVDPKFIEEYKGPRRVDTKGISDKEREEGKEKKRSVLESILFYAGTLFGSPVSDEFVKEVEQLGQIEVHIKDETDDEEHERAHLLHKHRAKLLNMYTSHRYSEDKDDHKIELISRYERLFDEHLAKLNVQISLLTTACFLCVLIFNQYCFDQDLLYFNDSYDHCPIAFWLKMVCWILWCVIVWRLIVYYAVKCERKKIIWGYENRIEAFVRSNLWIRFTIEIVLNALMPLPVWSDWGLQNNILVLLLFLRFYTWCRVLRDYSPIYKYRYKLQRVKKFVLLGLEVDPKTMVIWVFNVSPIGVMCFFIGVFTIIFGYLIYLTERQFWINYSTGDIYRALDYDGALQPEGYSKSPLSNFNNCLWYSIVTLTSLGFGDYFPYGWQGRTMASLDVLVGIVLTSLLSSIIIRGTNMSKADLVVLHTLQWKEFRHETYHYAADLIKRFIQHRIRQKNAHPIEPTSAISTSRNNTDVEVEMVEISPSGPSRSGSRSQSNFGQLSKRSKPLTTHSRWNAVRINLKPQFKRFRRARIKLARLENRLLEEKGINLVMQNISKKAQLFSERLDELEKYTSTLYPPQIETKTSAWKKIMPRLTEKPSSKPSASISSSTTPQTVTTTTTTATTTQKQLSSPHDKKQNQLGHLIKKHTLSSNNNNNDTNLESSKAYMRPSIRAIVDSKKQENKKINKNKIEIINLVGNIPGGTSSANNSNNSSASNSTKTSRSGSTRDLDIGTSGSGSSGEPGSGGGNGGRGAFARGGGGAAAVGSARGGGQNNSQQSGDIELGKIRLDTSNSTSELDLFVA